MKTMPLQTISTPAPVAPETLRCPLDGTATRLTCVQCGRPICPSCLVKTPVGLKCPTCVSSPAPARGRHRPSVRVAVALVAAALAVPAALASVGGPSDGPEEIVSTEVSPGGPTTGVVGQETTVGTFTVTVTGVDCTAGDLGTAPATRAPKGRFCVAAVRVRNNALVPRVFPTPFQRLTDGARRFAADTVTAARPPLVLASGARELTPVPLNPGLTVEGVLVFDLPPNVDPTALELRAGPATAPSRWRRDPRSRRRSSVHGH